MPTSTENIDPREKLLAYKRIDTLQEYVLVSQDNVEVEVYKKNEQGNWLRQILSKADALALNSVDLQLTMAEIYEDIMNF